MKQNKNLSLKEEMEKEAKKIEEDILNNPDLEDVKVSDEMEAALLSKIQSFEKKRAMEHNKADGMAENAAEEFSGKVTEERSNFSKRTNDGNIIHLSDEDMEALRLGRELLKKKNKEDELFEVDTEIHKHLNSDKDKKEGRKSTGEKAKVFRMPRKRRVIVALVAVCALVVGTGVTSVGSKSYLKVLWERMVGEEKAEILNVEDMERQETDDGTEINAYKEISNVLGATVVRIKNMPEDMNLENYNIDEGQDRAQLFYKYNGEVLRYSIYMNDLDSSLGQKEVDELTDSFIVTNTQQDIEVKEYYVKENKNYRYIADFEYLGIHYQIKGVIDKSEFVELIKNLKYYTQ